MVPVALQAESTTVICHRAHSRISKQRLLVQDFATILQSDTTSQIIHFSRECFLRHYGRQLKTAVEKEAGEKIDNKR